MRLRRHQAGRGPALRHIINRMGNGLMQIGMHLIEIGLHGIDERNVQPVLPDARRTVFTDPVFMPGAIGGKDEVVGAERHLVTVDDGVGPTAFHDETQGRRRMTMRRRALARMHHLQPRIQPANRRRNIAAARIVEVDHAAPGLLGSNQFDRTQHMVA